MILQNWWISTLLKNQYAPVTPLKNKIKVDVLIIGGGMTGISAAHGFIGSGLKVALIEKNIIGGSSTGRSAGFLTPDSELELNQLERRFGIEGAKSIWKIPTEGIDIIVNNVKKYNLDCDLVTQDSLFLGLGQSGKTDTKDEIDSRTQAGFKSQYYDKSSLSKLINGDAFSSAVRYSQTYGISALQYVQGMKNILQEHGIAIYETTEALEFSGHQVKTHSGEIEADQIIIAIDKMESSFSPYANQTFHAQTFLSISEPLSDNEIKELFPSGETFQCWDNSLVYSYWRLTGQGRMLLGGGSALTTFTNQWYNSESVIDSVIGNFKSRFPFLKNLHFLQYWPGQIDTTRDLLPTLFKDPIHSHIHYAMGIVGLPWASFCGDFLARVILGKAQHDQHTYFSFLSERRHFTLPVGLEKAFGKPAVFALNNLWAKYYQVDTKRDLKFEKGEF